jgi:hypothetical protein
LSIDLHAIIAVDNAWLKVAVSTWPRLHHGGTGSISTKDALEEMRRMSCLEMSHEGKKSICKWFE